MQAGGAERLASSPQPRQIPGVPLQARRGDPPPVPGLPPPGASLPAATCPPASLRRKARGGGKRGLTCRPLRPSREGSPGFSQATAPAPAGTRGPSTDSAPPRRRHRHRRRRRHGPSPRRRSRGRPCASTAGVCSVPGLPTRRARAGT